MTQHGDRGWNGTYAPININSFITHPSHLRLYHTTGVYAPYSLRTPVLVFLRPKKSEHWKSCETGPLVFRPYPRRHECLTICRSHNKGSTYQTPWVLVWPGYEPATSRSATLPRNTPVRNNLHQTTSTIWKIIHYIPSNSHHTIKIIARKRLLSKSRVALEVTVYFIACFAIGNDKANILALIGYSHAWSITHIYCTSLLHSWSLMPD